MTRRTPSLRLRASLCLPFSLLAALAFSGCSGGSGGGNSAPSRAPAPIVANISPATVPTGSSAFTLAVTGSNFQPQALVNWNSSALATTYNSATSLSAAVPANLAATGIIANITVSNPDGQASASSGASTQVSVTNPAPTLTSVTPITLLAGSSDTTFTLTGTNFNTSSVAMAGTAALATTFVSSTQLTAVAPATTLAPVGTLSLSVTNPAPGGGATQAVSVTLRQPPAKLASLAPLSAVAGSPATTVTITGSYFTPTAVVYFGNSATATTYISPTSIQFTIPTQNYSSAVNLSVLVRDPASQSFPSNGLTFAIVNPVPVLNSISPGSVTAGAPNFTLNLSGSNFLSSSTVLINGTAVQPNLYPTATAAQVIIPANAVSAVGDISIAISNPTPGGGPSAAQTIHVIPASNRIRTVNLAANDLGWDSAHNLIVASSGSSITNTPNAISTIDPLQGTIVATQPLPSPPAGISVTDDGSYVYVTLPSTGQIERFTLPSLTPDITFALGTDTSGNLYTTAKVTAAPGHPHTVAIARHVNGTIPMDAVGGIAVYDDGVARLNISIPSGLYNYYDSIIWGSDSTTLYGTNAGVSAADEQTFAVNATGVTLLSDRPSVIGQFVQHLTFDSKNGHLVDGYGDVVSAGTGQYLGKMLVQNTLSYEENPFALDTSQRKVFYLNANGFYLNSQPGGEYIQAFDADQFNYINSLLVEGLTGASTIIRWGTSGLALNGQQIYLIDGSFVSPVGSSSAVGGYVAPSPTLNSINPASATAGSPDVQITLTGRDFTQASQVIWNNQNLLINSLSDTQIVATISASMLASPVASGITITNGPGTGPSGSLGFTVLPSLGSNSQFSALDISGQELAWDNTHNLLYVAVPYTDPIYPNTIAVIDPSTLTVQQAIPAANQPSTIAVSDDNQYLYAGSWGQSIIQRYTLPSFSLDLTIPTDTAVGVVGNPTSCTYPADIKVAPGNPQTIAVVAGNFNLSPRDCGNVTIYDNAVPRSLTAPGHVSILTLEWGADASTLFTQESGFLMGNSVTSSGITSGGALNNGTLGNRVHFDSATGLLFSDSGVITNPVGPAQVGKLASGTGDLLVTDDTLKRVFVLSNTNGNSGSGVGAVSYALNIYDLNTQALLNSIAIPGLLGYPNQMARWGSSGLVIVTSPNNLTTAPGVLYVLQGSAITGTP